MFDNGTHDHACGHSSVEDDKHLRQVYGRVKSYMLGVLTEKNGDTEQWKLFLAQEQSKIDKLNTELKDLQSEPVCLVPEKGEDISVPDYPRRGFPYRNGKNRSRRK